MLLRESHVPSSSNMQCANIDACFAGSISLCWVLLFYLDVLLIKIIFFLEGSSDSIGAATGC